MLITRQSLITGISRTLDVPVTQDQLDLWKSGVFIQDAMPDLPKELREFIMTGITAEEWATMPEL